MSDVKYILLTGADGNLGGKLTRLLADSTDYGVIAVSSFPERIPGMIEREKIVNRDRIIQLSSDEMFGMELRTMNIKGAVHFAFSRAIFPNKDIANSLDYSLAAFEKMIDSGIESGIYISSQSVYGDTLDWRRVEETPPAPNSIYAMAKYAGEKLFEACYKGNESLQHSILRLDNVVQSQNLVSALCRAAKEKGALSLKGGKQVFSYIDVEDVPRAVLALLDSRKPWRHVYNVGPNRMRVTLVEVAQMVRTVASEHGRSVEIFLEENDTMLGAGMDTSAFQQDTGWEPSVSLKEMITKIYQAV